MQARNDDIPRGSRLYLQIELDRAQATAQTTRHVRPQVPAAIVRPRACWGKALSIAGFGAHPGALTPADCRLNVTTDYRLWSSDVTDNPLK
jgi:hypothetical protein